MARIDDIAEEIRNDVETHYNSHTITKSVWNEAVAVDDVMEEDPAMVMSSYSEIKSVRVSYGGGEIYDLFVAKVK